MSLKKSKKLTKKSSANIVDDNKYVPEKFEGTLEPNFFCRGWNSKRDKYCKQRAGHNTNHPGVGRCAWHGKGGVTTHGRYAKHLGPKLKEHLENIQAEGGDRTDISQEVDMFRAITAKFIEEYDEFVEALLEWNRQDSIEKAAKGARARPKLIPDIVMVANLTKDAAALADKIHAQEHRDSIPKRDFFRLQDAMSDIVANRLRGVTHILGDDAVSDLINSISDAWSEIRL